MRITRIERLTGIPETPLAPAMPAALLVTFVDAGVETRLRLELPAGWDTWTRQRKVGWGRQQVADHLLINRYVPGSEIIYPDLAAPETAKGDFENLPGWATWTAAEAEAWISANVTSLATAKIALQAMARAIVYLRDVMIER